MLILIKKLFFFLLPAHVGDLKCEAEETDQPQEDERHISIRQTFCIGWGILTDLQALLC